MGPTTSLALSAVESIVQVIVIALFGYILARKGLIDSANQRWLSALNMNFFTPTLLFTKMAFIITPEKFLAYWPIPVFYIFFAIASFSMARLGSRYLHLDRSYRDFVTVAIMFSNTNSLPIAVMQSLALSKAGKALYWKTDDDQDSVAARGISYILFFAIFGNLLRWSYGYSLIQEPPRTIPMATQHRRNGSNASFIRPSSRPLSAVREAILVDFESSSPPLKRTLSRMDTADYLGLMNENGDEARGGWHDGRPPSLPQLGDETLFEEEEEPDEEYEPPMVARHDATTGLLAFPTLRDEQPRKGLLARLIPRRLAPLIAKFSRGLRSIVSPPLIAASLALFVGLIPPLQSILFDRKSIMYLSFTRALEQCGSAAIPIILICLGAQMHGLRRPAHADAHAAGPRAANPASDSVWLVMLTRTLVIPLIVIPSVVLFVYMGDSVSTIAQDPVFGLTMIILGCGPTAINIIQICQAKGAFEDEMGRVLFWSYVVAAVPVMTIVVLIALWGVTNNLV